MLSTVTKNSIVICGPTASGKTALGVRLALRTGGEIISCDSRQVYRGMDIGTGKDLGEYHTAEGDVAYHLIDIANPADVYTVYRYQRDFRRVFEEIRSRKKLPVVVGGDRALPRSGPARVRNSQSARRPGTQALSDAEGKDMP